MGSDNLAWFEFLLNPTLLEEHLNKKNADPSPINLIVQFIYHGIKRNDIPSGETDAATISYQIGEKKKRLLSILSLKVAAFLNWNLDVLQQSLPLHIEDALMSGLLIETLEEHSNPSTHTTLDPALLLPHQLYSVSLYHRYALSVIIKAKLPSKPQKISNVPIPGQQDPLQESREVQDAIIAMMERGSENSIRILEQMLTSAEIRMPTLQTFSMPTGENHQHPWHLCKYIPDEQFKCQIHYDLGVFHFLQERFADAFHHFSEAISLIPDLGTSPDFCTVDEAALRAYFTTCANICGRATPLEKRSIVDRYNHSLNNNHEGLIEILAEDNIELKIPFYLRQTLQLDLMTNIEKSPEGLLFQVQTVNTIREVLEGKIWDNLYCVALLQSGKMRVQFLVQMLVSKLTSYSPTQRGRICAFIRMLAMSDGLREILVPQLMGCASLMSLFTHEEIVEMWQGSEDKTGAATKRAFDTSLRADYSDISDLIWDLLHSYDFRLLERAFNCYLTVQPPRSNIHKSDVIDLNAKWKDMIPMLILNMAMKLLQDPQRNLILLYIAKAEELSLAKSFPKSLELLTEASNLVRNSLGNEGNRLSKMLSWLILVNKIQKLIYELPCVEEAEIQKLTGEAKRCLAAVNNRDGVAPWTKVIYWCLLLLLNAQDWATLLGGYVPSSSHFPLMHLVKPLAAAAQALQDKVNNEKPWAELFHIVLSILIGSIQHKRSIFGQISDRLRECPVIMPRQMFMEFLENVKEPYCLSILTSLLGHLFNILTEDPDRTLHIDHLTMWPRHISQEGSSTDLPGKDKNSNEWKIMNETLTWVVDHATQLYPSGVHASNSMCASWFQTKGDIAFYHKNDYKAIQNYLTSFFVATDYLHNDSNLPDQQSLDDAIIKRMIKCSMNLRCFTQAAILCQFLEPIDYSTAIGCLQERNSVDAMDAYYNCLWDVTLMEFIINMHQKKGETQRRDQVMKIIGLLEINANNNEEIQREAAKVRKHRFLRALAKQYL